MLERILNHIHNFFEKDIVSGEYTVSNGAIDLDFLQYGQYFRIRGSVFNDGVYRYPASNLVDETFAGEIWAMAVPPAVIALANEIEEWNTKYLGVDSQAMSPYNSESFGGYSYSKGSGSSSSGSGGVSWQNIFRSRLNEWRKI